MLLSRFNFRLYVNGISVVKKKRLCTKLQLPSDVDAVIVYGYVDDRAGICFKTVGCAIYDPFSIVWIEEMPDYTISYQSLRDCEAMMYYDVDSATNARLWRRAADAIAKAHETEGIRQTRTIGYLDRYRLDYHPDILLLPYAADPEDTVMIRLVEIDGTQIVGVVMADPEFFCSLREGDKVCIEANEEKEGIHVFMRRI